MPRGRSTFTKRQKEQTRQQKQRDKAERRTQRKQEKPADGSVDEMAELREHAAGSGGVVQPGRRRIGSRRGFDPRKRANTLTAAGGASRVLTTEDLSSLPPSGAESPRLYWPWVARLKAVPYPKRFTRQLLDKYFSGQCGQGSRRQSVFNDSSRLPGPIGVNLHTFNLQLESALDLTKFQRLRSRHQR